jgi:hypothetical protein
MQHKRFYVLILTQFNKLENRCEDFDVPRTTEVFYVLKQAVAY